MTDKSNNTKRAMGDIEIINNGGEKIDCVASIQETSKSSSADMTIPPEGGNLPATGRIKAPPICRVPSLRKMNMTAEALSEWCFDLGDVLNDSNAAHVNGDSNNDDGGVGDGDDDDVTATSDQWAKFKENILQRTESRNGRDHQRFANDPETGHLLRLTTGSVPIMKDGRILLISSSRKEEWILPKGGWESDEEMEVSALRETYEEGGILGILGPQLKIIDFETRKAKKRRLELESLRKKCEFSKSPNSLTPQSKHGAFTTSSAASLQSISSTYHSEDDMQGSGHSRDHNHNGVDVVSEIPPSTSTDFNVTKIKQNVHEVRNVVADRPDADAVSVSSAASFKSSVSISCDHCRLNMFPLYVLEVREHWPESGRARKIVDIDTAIGMMTSRPEFHQVLLEVKEKGYHLKPHKRILSNTHDTDNR